MCSHSKVSSRPLKPLIMSFEGADARELQAFARQANLSAPEMVGRSVKLGGWVDAEMIKGNRVVIVDKRGRIIKEVISF